jgi:phosphate-selective porin OprO/OprP
MHKGIIMVGLLALALAAQSAGAKTLEEVLKEKGVITEADYNDIMKDKPKTPPVSYKLGQGMTFTSPDDRFQLAISGQMQFRYTFFDNDGIGIVNKSEWRIRRLKTNFNGYTFTKDLTFKMNLNWANLLNNGDGSTVIEETYMNYRIIDEAQIRVGQDKVQYGRNWITPSSQNEFVETAFVTDAFKPGYDIGLGANGTVQKGLLTYAAQWVGGKGQNTVSSTNNNAYNLRLAVNPLGDMKYSEADIEMSPKPLLSVGSSYYHNTLKKNTALTFEKNNNNYAGANGWLGRNAAQFSPVANVNINTFESDMAFKWMGLFVQTEYFWGQGTGTGTSANGYDANVISNGFYAQAGYMVLPKKVELAVRYAWMDYNRNTPNNNQTEVQGAISWYIEGHNLKIQADVTKQNVQVDKTNVYKGVTFHTNVPLDNTIFRAQAQLLF